LLATLEAARVLSQYKLMASISLVQLFAGERSRDILAVMILAYISLKKAGWP